MKCLILSLVVFTSSLIFPQQNQENYKTIALSFEVYALSLSDFYGGVGGKLWLAENFAINASLGGGINKSKYENEREEFNREYRNDSYSIVAGIGIENHLGISDDISAYIPIRTSFWLNRYNSESSIDTTNIIYERTQRTQSINLEFGLGFEYWLTQRISIAGQHLLDLYYRWGREELPYETGNIDRFSEYGFRNGTSALILSVYF